MKRTILLAALVLGCRSAPMPEPVTSTGSVSGSSMPGAPSPRQAIDRFLAGVDNADLQEIAAAWGTSKGPARDQMERSELEKRLILFQSCYENDRYRILDEVPGEAGQRVFRVELSKGAITRTPRFSMVRGPSDRWYVADADFTAVTALCKQQK